MKLLAVLFSLLAAPAFAQPSGRCGPHDELIAKLAEVYQEVVKWSGLHEGPGLPPDTVMEMAANDSTGTWTIIVSAPGQAACIVAAGTGFKAGPADIKRKAKPGERSA